jgi:hypothetical protein
MNVLFPAEVMCDADFGLPPSNRPLTRTVGFSFSISAPFASFKAWESLAWLDTMLPGKRGSVNP